jgi:hypothetical protein
MIKRIKLSTWAEQNEYTYRGAYNVFKRGAIPGAFRSPSGAILVDVEENDNGNTVIEDKKSIVRSFISLITSLSKEKLSKIIELLEND